MTFPIFAVLFEADGNGTEVHEFAEEAFNEAAVAIGEGAERRAAYAAGHRLEVGPCAKPKTAERGTGSRVRHSSMGPELSPEAARQLALRHRLACEAAEGYLDAGFSVVYQDILIGPALGEVADRLHHRSPAIIALSPKPEVLAQRDRDRAKRGYGEHFPPSVLASAFEHETPRLGLWVDTSDMSADEAVERILGQYGQG